MKPLMIYGANGYTGRLVTAVALARGHTPILAGRHPQRVADMARQLKLPARIFGLRNANEAARFMDGVGAVIHCAGPFSATAAPMLAACMKAKAHYLDISGEIDVFEMLHGQDAAIVRAGICAVAGVGFDVVPTDCLAALLKEQMSDATTLTLAFDPQGSKFSTGTAKTMVEGIGQGGRIRRDGLIVADAPGSRTRQLPLAANGRLGMAIPWGDVSTAFHSTGIPNIEVYTTTSPGQLRLVRLLHSARWLLSWGPVQYLLKQQIQKRVKGPEPAARGRATVHLWGEVRNAAGHSAQLWMRTPEGYTFTAESAVRAAERLLSSPVPAGFHTPSQAFGARFVTELPGVVLSSTPLTPTPELP